MRQLPEDLFHLSSGSPLDHWFSPRFSPSAPTSTPNIQRARFTRASGVFRYFPSPLHHKAVKNYASVTCGWRVHPSFLHRWRQKRRNPSPAKHTVSINCEWRWRVKASISNSLSARCAGACPSARTEVRRKKRRMPGLGRSMRRFPKNGEEEEKRREVSQESPQAFVQPLSVLKKMKYFSRERFDYSKLKSYFCAWQNTTFPSSRRPAASI